METKSISEETNSYAKVLELFAAGADGYRDWMKSPFLVGERVMSTNGHSIAIAEKGLVGEYEHLGPVETEKVLAVIPASRNKNFEISASNMAEIIKMCPRVPEENIDSSACEACDGDGEITVDFYHNGKSYDIEADCPVCDGSGAKKIISNKLPIMIFDRNFYIKIGNSFFGIQLFSQLYSAAQILKASEIVLTQQESHNQGSMFKVGQMEILVMPMLRDGLESKHMLCDIQIEEVA